MFPEEEVLFIKQGEFYINGQDSLVELNAVLATIPLIPRAKRKRTTTALISGSRLAITDESAYDNVEFDLTITVNAQDEHEMTYYGDKLFSAFDSAGYIPFIYYADSQYTYHIFNADNVAVERPARMSWVRTYTFKVSAGGYKYLNTEPIEITQKSFTVTNPLFMQARPLIKLYGNGNLALTVNGHTYVYNGVTDYIEIDCAEENQDVYKTNLNGTATLLNDKIPANQDFPVLKTGVNKIGLSNTITKIIIDPRWRTV